MRMAPPGSMTPSGGRPRRPKRPKPEPIPIKTGLIPIDGSKKKKKRPKPGTPKLLPYPMAKGGMTNKKGK